MTKFQKILLIDGGDDVIYIDRANIVKVKPFEVETEIPTGHIACDRRAGELKGSIWLNNGFDYVLTQDSHGFPCLVVLTKKAVNNR